MNNTILAGVLGFVGAIVLLAMTRHYSVMNQILYCDNPRILGRHYRNPLYAQWAQINSTLRELYFQEGIENSNDFDQSFYSKTEQSLLYNMFHFKNLLPVKADEDRYKNFYLDVTQVYHEWGPKFVVLTLAAIVLNIFAIVLIILHFNMPHRFVFPVNTYGLVLALIVCLWGTLDGRLYRHLGDLNIKADTDNELNNDFSELLDTFTQLDPSTFKTVKINENDHYIKPTDSSESILGQFKQASSHVVYDNAHYVALDFVFSLKQTQELIATWNQIVSVNNSCALDDNVLQHLHTIFLEKVYDVTLMNDLNVVIKELTDPRLISLMTEHPKSDTAAVLIADIQAVLMRLNSRLLSAIHIALKLSANNAAELKFELVKTGNTDEMDAETLAKYYADLKAQTSKLTPESEDD